MKAWVLVARGTIFATMAGYGDWGKLLKTDPASTVAPFSLLIPMFSTTSAYLGWVRRSAPWPLAGMALILTGLAVVVLPKMSEAATATTAHR